MDYVRDDRFQAIILSIAEGEYDAPAPYVGPDAIADFVKTYDWSDACTIMHNAAFDATVLSLRYGIVPLGSLIL